MFRILSSGNRLVEVGNLVAFRRYCIHLGASCSDNYSANDGRFVVAVVPKPLSNRVDRDRHKRHSRVSMTNCFRLLNFYYSLQWNYLPALLSVFSILYYGLNLHSPLSFFPFLRTRKTRTKLFIGFNFKQKLI